MSGAHYEHTRQNELSKWLKKHESLRVQRIILLGVLVLENLMLLLWMCHQ